MSRDTLDSNRPPQRADRLVAGLREEILLPPVRESLADLAAGLQRLALLHPGLTDDSDVADLIAIAGALCDPGVVTVGPRVVRPAGWAGPAIVDGPLGPAAVTPAGVAFAAGCDAGWLARYCDHRPRSWEELGGLCAALAEHLLRVAERLRTADDDRVEAGADVDIDLTLLETAAKGVGGLGDDDLADGADDELIAGLARSLVDAHARATARLQRLDRWSPTPARLAEGGGFVAEHPGTVATLDRLGRRLACTAELLAQVETARLATVRSLAYGDVDQEGLGADVSDLWLDTQGDVTPPAAPADAEAAIIASLRDAAFTALLDAAGLMAIPVVDPDLLG